MSGTVISKDDIAFLESKFKTWASFIKPFWPKLNRIISKTDLTNCSPKAPLILNPFSLCRLEKLKVVVLGGEPYKFKGHANGLAFGIDTEKSEGYIPNSLKAIEKSIQLYNKNTDPIDYSLKYLAKQGVLLLNSALSVPINSCNNFDSLESWSPFITYVLEKLNAEHSDIVFILMGSIAKKYTPLINTDNNRLIEVDHPALEYTENKKQQVNFHNRDVFYRTNKLLNQMNKESIKW